MIPTIFGLGVLLCLAINLVMLPNISRPTVPLGVSVPHRYINDPVVRMAICRFRAWCIGLAIPPTLGILLTGQTNTALTVWWPIGYLLAAIVAFVLCRRPIITKKREQGWYNEVTTRITATVTRQPPQTRVLWTAHLLSLTVSTISFIALVIAYPGLPDPFPMHYDAAGNVDRYTARTWGAVLLVPSIALATAVTLLIVCLAVARRQDPLLPDADPDAARTSALGRAHLVQTVLAWTSVMTSIVLDFAGAAMPILNLPVSTNAVLLWGLSLSTLPFLIWVLWRAAALHRPTTHPAVSGPDSPDDDVRWKGGLFYVNPDDPRLFVPKRTGIGLTTNFGRPGGYLFLIGLIALCVIITLAAINL